MTGEELNALADLARAAVHDAYAAPRDLESWMEPEYAASLNALLAGIKSISAALRLARAEVERLRAALAEVRRLQDGVGTNDAVRRIVDEVLAAAALASGKGEM